MMYIRPPLHHPLTSPGLLTMLFTPGPLLTLSVTETLKLVQKTKQKYYQKIATEANAQNIWQLRDWTRCKKMFTSPPISMGDNTPPPTTHKQKYLILSNHLFPEPPPLPEEPTIHLTPNNEDTEY